MRRWIRISAWAGGALLLAGVAAAIAAVELGERKRFRTIDVPARAVALDTSADGIARGAYLYRSRGCADCHDTDGHGKVFMQDGDAMRIKAPNISPGAGSVVARYRAEDWDRTLRHGVKPDGTPLMVMPSEDYSRLTDADLGALVAFIRQLPPAAGAAAEFRLPAIVTAMYGLGAIRDAAEKIDHAAAPPRPVPAAITADYGAYVAAMCQGCHGAALAGGRIPGAPPDWPPAADLRPGAQRAMSRYPDADRFIAMLRSGRRPDGSAVSPVMPFNALREIDDVEARALHAYLRALPTESAMVASR